MINSFKDKFVLILIVLAIINSDMTQEAQIPFIYAKYGFGKIDNEQYYINSLLDLERVADKLFNL